MNQIFLTDNNCGKQKIPLDKKQYDDISFFANKSVNELAQNKNFLVFPQTLCTDDELGELEIVKLQGSSSDENCTLTTQNLMGFVGKGGTEISITSRFTEQKNSEQSGRDFFLHYMIQKVFCPSVVDLKYSAQKESGGTFDFLMYLFPFALKKTCAQGLVRIYKNFKNNDANVKGTIDVSRQIKSNIPFGGKIAYNYRSFSTDNFITELVRHTIEFIKEKGANHVLCADGETMRSVRMILENTPSYSKNERAKILRENCKPFFHPYFTEYKTLQKLCLQILCHEKLNFALSKNEVYGVIFDGAWLWEEFLWTVLKNRCPKIIHPRNKKKTDGIKFFEKGGRNFYPDFRISKDENQDESKIILDAKYKKMSGDKNDEDFGTNGNARIQREDLFQMISYIHVQNAEEGIFLYPYPYEGENFFKAEFIHSDPRTLKGKGGKIRAIGFPVLLKAKSQREYTEAMEGFLQRNKELFITQELSKNNDQSKPLFESSDFLKKDR